MMVLPPVGAGGRAYRRERISGVRRGSVAQQDGVCLTTVRRLRQETAKKEELAVQRPRRISPALSRRTAARLRRRGAG